MQMELVHATRAFRAQIVLLVQKIIIQQESAVLIVKPQQPAVETEVVRMMELARATVAILQMIVILPYLLVIHKQHVTETEHVTAMEPVSVALVGQDQIVCHVMQIIMG